MSSSADGAPEPDPKEMSRLCMVALDAALRDDPATLNEAMNELTDTGGWASLFGACCAFGAVVLKDAPKVEGGVATLHAFNVETGETMNVDRIGVDREVIAALRMLTYLASKDVRAAKDVFFVEVRAGKGMEAVEEMLTMAVAQLTEHSNFTETYGFGVPQGE